MLVVIGDPKLACTASESVTDDDIRARALNEIAAALAAADLPAESLEARGRAWTSARSVFIGWPVLLRTDPNAALKLADLLLN